MMFFEQCDTLVSQGFVTAPGACLDGEAQHLNFTGHDINQMMEMRQFVFETSG